MCRSPLQHRVILSRQWNRIERSAPESPPPARCPGSMPARTAGLLQSVRKLSFAHAESSEETIQNVLDVDCACYVRQRVDGTAKMHRRDQCWQCFIFNRGCKGDHLLTCLFHTKTLPLSRKNWSIDWRSSIALRYHLGDPVEKFAYAVSSCCAYGVHIEGRCEITLRPHRDYRCVRQL